MRVRPSNSLTPLRDEGISPAPAPAAPTLQNDSPGWLSACNLNGRPTGGAPPPTHLTPPAGGALDSRRWQELVHGQEHAALSIEEVDLQPGYPGGPRRFLVSAAHRAAHRAGLLVSERCDINGASLKRQPTPANASHPPAIPAVHLHVDVVRPARRWVRILPPHRVPTAATAERSCGTQNGTRPMPCRESDGSAENKRCRLCCMADCIGYWLAFGCWMACLPLAPGSTGPMWLCWLAGVGPECWAESFAASLCTASFTCGGCVSTVCVDCKGHRAREPPKEGRWGTPRRGRRGTPKRAHCFTWLFMPRAGVRSHGSRTGQTVDKC